MRLRIIPSALGGAVSAPPSKSYTHRAVIVGSLAQGKTVIENVLMSDDTRYTVDACHSLGIEIRHEGETLTINGNGGIFSAASEPKRIFVGNSGSTIRMVAPLATSTKPAIKSF